MGWAEVQTQVKAIDGLLREEEAGCLYSLARNCGGNIVEIGSWKGKSTVCLALGSKVGSGGKVFAIDPHQGLADDCAELHWAENTEPIFRENIKKAKADDIVIPLVMKSEEAVTGWAEPISLLFIDGAHDYESVKKDFLLWAPYLKEGGFIAFHDVLYSFGHNYPGVRKVVYKYIFQSNKFSSVQFCGTMVYATKARPSMLERFRKLQKLPLYYSLPLVYPALGFVAGILATFRLLKPARVIKYKILALMHRRSSQE